MPPKGSEAGMGAMGGSMEVGYRHRLAENCVSFLGTILQAVEVFLT